MNFLYYLACIGKPDLDTKLTIVRHNVNHLFTTLQHPFDMILNCYETDTHTIKLITRTLTQTKQIRNLYVHIKRGVLTEVFLSNPYNERVKNYDSILFILDDVKLLEFDLPDMLRIKNKYNLTVCSPKIKNATHHFMASFPPTIITRNNFLEVYLLLLSPSDFDTFLSIHTVENKWMWGADLLFGYYKIPAGIVHKYTAGHVLPSKSNHNEAYHTMITYIQKKTTFVDMNEIRAMYKPIIEFITYE